MPSPNKFQAFIDDYCIGMAQIGTANTNRDGTGTLGTIVTGGKNGTEVSLIKYKATGATTAGMIHFYLDDGANVRLWYELAVSAVATPGGSTLTDEGSFAPTAFVLPEAWELQAGTENAETFNVFAFGGHL